VSGHQVSSQFVLLALIKSKLCSTSLAWAELYLIMGNVFRKLDLTEKGTSLVSF
jgi:hypothetical protein